MKTLDPILEREHPELFKDEEIIEEVAEFADILFTLWGHWRSRLRDKGMHRFLESMDIDRALIQQLEIQIWG